MSRHRFFPAVAMCCVFLAPGSFLQAATAAGGRDHSAVVLPDGSVWVWGANNRGQLGNGSAESSPVPLQLFGLSNIVAVASGEAHFLALTGGGDVWAWGANDSGQLGDGTNEDRFVPVLVLRGAAKIDAGTDYSLATKRDGSLWRWGADHRDGRGIGNDGSSNVPILISRADSKQEFIATMRGIAGVLAVAEGRGHVLARLTDGTVWSRGRNDFGQLGDGTVIGRPEPVPIALKDIVEIAAGHEHGLAVSADGVVWTWGRNSAGQLGDGTRDDSAVPIAISEPGFRWKVGRPVLDPPGGSYEATLNVTVTSATEGASILYSTAPEGVPNSEIASGGTARVDETATLLARALAPDQPPSDVTAAEYILELTAVRFAPPGGVYTAPLRVEFVGPEGAAIHYTVGGDAPDKSSALYIEPILIEETSTVRARAFKPGWQPSAGTVAFYRLKHASLTPTPNASPGTKADGSIFADGFESGDTSAWSGTVTPPDPPQISPDAGIYEREKTVSILCPGGEAAHFTIDGTTPTSESPEYEEPFTIIQSTTVKAGCYEAPAGMSSIVESTFTLRVPRPAMSPSGGTFNVPQTVAVTCSLEGAVIHYTTNGAVPTESDPMIASGGTLVLDAGVTIKAAAWKTGWTASTPRSQTYTMKVGAPTISPEGGTYPDAQTVTVSTVTPGASLTYTLDGSEPSAVGPVVVSGATLEIDRSTTLRVKGFRLGWLDSNGASASYFLAADSVAAPIFDPAPGTFSGEQVVEISSATPGSSIRYTTDGSEPYAGSALYVGPVTLDTTVTLKAKAFAHEMAPSAITSGLYEIGSSGAVAMPNFVPPPGRFATGPDVAVATATPDATVRFTTSGDDPLMSDTEIPAGETIEIESSTVLKAKAWKTGLDESGVRSGFYVVTGDLAVGSGFVLGLLADGTVVAWGGNWDGQLGDGTTSAKTLPVPVSGLDDIVAVAAGESHSMALRSDGIVFCWGLNTDGQLGDGTTAPSLVPKQVPGLSDVVAIDAGDRHALALKSDGTVWVWGENDYWQLGDGTKTTRTSPVQISVPATVVSVAGGRYHSLALTADGEVWGWGWNNQGQVGDGTTAVRSTPVPVPGLIGITRIDAGQFFSLALQTDGLEAGTLWGWGDNGYGQIAAGDINRRESPVQILDDVTDMGTGPLHALAVKQDGSLWAWGAGGGTRGRLGDGARVNRFAPVQVWGLRDVVAVDGGGSFSVAVRVDGTVFSWGYNIGDTSSDTPVAEPDLNLVDNSWLTNDIDGDGLNAWDEYQYGCDPLAFDTNGDGLGDGTSVGLGMSCSSPDLDGDGLRNPVELSIGTSPWDADSDDDGSPDGTDCAPLDPTRWECPNNPADTTPPVITILEPADATPLP